MATFLQWNRSRLARQVTWACGPEWPLVHEVIDEYRKLDVPSCSFYADSSEPESKLWDSLMSWPHGGSLAVVYRAQRLTMLDRVELVTESVPDLSYVLFVSAEEDFARAEVDGKKVLAPHLAAIRSSKSGQLVRCCKPSREEDLLKVIASWWPGAGLNFASALLARCAGQLGAAYTACRTAQASGLAAEERWLDMACQAVPQARYADELLAGHRVIALEQAARLSDAEAASVLGLLSSRLATLTTYNSLRSRDLDAEQIARKGVDRWHQKMLAPYAAAYPPSRVTYCRRLLAMAEDAFRSGVRSGLLESVATLW